MPMDNTIKTITTVPTIKKSPNSQQSLVNFSGTPSFQYSGPVLFFDCQFLILEYKIEYLLQQGMPPHEVNDFMNAVFTPDWLDLLLRGGDWDELSHLAVTHYPEHRDAIILFQHCFSQTIIDEYPYMRDMIKALRKRGYPLYLVCDMHRDMLTQTSSHYDIFDCFNGSILSGDTGERLCDTLLPTACKLLNIPPSQCLFITANPEYQSHVQAMGITPIVFETKKQFEQHLNQAGINTKPLQEKP